jgi:hypothetical protein
VKVAGVWNAKGAVDDHVRGYALWTSMVDQQPRWRAFIATEGRPPRPSEVGLHGTGGLVMTVDLFFTCDGGLVATTSQEDTQGTLDRWSISTASREPSGACGPIGNVPAGEPANDTNDVDR